MTETGLTKYNAAKRALAEARSVDEVKDIRDKAMAMRVYAVQARDRTLEEDAIEIRLRAERRLGEMMGAQPKARGAIGFGGNQYTGKVDRGVSNTPRSNSPKPLTLDEAGIDKNLAKRARRLANMTDDEFTAAVGKARRSRIFSSSLGIVEKVKSPNDGVIQTLRVVLYELNRIKAVDDHECAALLAQIRDRAIKLMVKAQDKENVYVLRQGS